MQSVSTSTPMSKSAEMNCVDFGRFICTRGACGNGVRSACIRRGGKPSSPVYSIVAPSVRRASTNCPIGRFCIRGQPVSSTGLSVSAQYAVRNRIAVPQLFTSIHGSAVGLFVNRVRASCKIRTSSGVSSSIGNNGTPARACKTSRRLAIDLERGR